MDSKFWNGLLDWFSNTLIKKKTLSKSDLEVFNVVDTAEEAVGIIKRRVII
jgi:predicted Rossmann-fold nucleotide-binding protein